MTARRPKVRYTVTPNRLQNLVFASLPKRLLDRLLARWLDLSPR
jgi:hypothetical protein